MGKKKRELKAIASWQERIAEHQQKIESEMKRARPRWYLIEFWRKQIAAWEEQIKRKKRRLKP